MQKRMREIIALVVLIALIVGVVAFMAWYLHVGHNWNAAANVIDDMVGSMDRYSVVVYEGTKPVPEDDEIALSSNQASDKKSSSDGSSNSADSEASSEVVASSADSTSVNSASSAASEGTEESSGSAESSASSKADSSVSSSSAAKDSGTVEEKDDEVLTLGNVTESYGDKGAVVIQVHLDDMSLYEDPVIVSKGGKRIGIISTMNPLSSVKARVAAKELRGNYAVDTVIAILEDREDVRDGLSNIDIAICLKGEDVPEGGVMIGGTFTVGVPYIGEVQAVIIPKSGVLTSKTITSL